MSLFCMYVESLGIQWFDANAWDDKHSYWKRRSRRCEFSGILIIRKTTPIILSETSHPKSVLWNFLTIPKKTSNPQSACSQEIAVIAEMH